MTMSWQGWLRSTQEHPMNPGDAEDAAKRQRLAGVRAKAINAVAQVLNQTIGYATKARAHEDAYYVTQALERLDLLRDDKPDGNEPDVLGKATEIIADIFRDVVFYRDTSGALASVVDDARAVAGELFDAGLLREDRPAVSPCILCGATDHSSMQHETTEDVPDPSKFAKCSLCGGPDYDTPIEDAPDMARDEEWESGEQPEESKDVIVYYDPPGNCFVAKCLQGDYLELIPVPREARPDTYTEADRRAHILGRYHAQYAHTDSDIRAPYQEELTQETGYDAKRRRYTTPKVNR